MIRTIKKKFINLKINIKLWLCMLTVMLILVSGIGSVSLHIFKRQFMISSYERARNSLDATEQLFSETYLDLLKNIVKFVSTDTFRNFVFDTQENGIEHYTSLYNELQYPFSQLKNSNTLIKTVLVADGNNRLYSMYDTRLKDRYCRDIFSMNLNTLTSITWLPVQNNGVTGMPDVIPIVVPLTVMASGKYLVISDKNTQPVVTLILLIDSEKLTDFLQQVLPDTTDDSIYLADSQGNSMNLKENSPFFSLANNPTQINLVRTAEYNMTTFTTGPGKTYVSYAHPLNLSHLTLVHLISKSSLYKNLHAIQYSILLIALAALTITTGLVFVLAKLITSPLSRLTTAVAQIKTGDYRTQYIPDSTDEVGQLALAVNDMYETIQGQMEQIRQTEYKKRKYEMQLVAEQINPHFLYNTLECIDMEVLSKHTETASSMVENLGAFLRIGLNRGEDTVPIKTELAHVQAYFTIMNISFNGTVRLSCDVPQELTSHHILKTILQPLIENSFKHGFSRDNQLSVIQNPAIDIIFLKQNETLIIEVADNGYGIDIQKAEAHMYSSDPKQRIGLQNVYRRLCIFYGAAHIRFQTIPFFRNSVIITIPWCQ